MNKFLKSVELAQAMFDPESVINQHFSFAFFKDKILAIGRNSNKTHPYNLLNRKMGHNGKDISETSGVCSELSAVIRLKRITDIPFRKITLFNIRINKNRQVSMAHPCLSCKNLLSFCKFNEVYYSDWQGNLCQYY